MASTVGERLSEALEDRGWTAMDLERALPDVKGSSNEQIRRYTRGGSDPNLEFLETASEALGVSRAWLWPGIGAKRAGAASLGERSLYDVVSAETEEQRQTFDATLSKLRGFQDLTPLVKALFQNALARWIGPPRQKTFEECEDRTVQLWGLLLAPLEKLGTRGELAAEPSHRRETDYLVAMLHALMLAMPEWD
jgi:transcriptional regulator with XRE-family HTH domain